jgi:hypothetical protein
MATPDPDAFAGSAPRLPLRLALLAFTLAGVSFGLSQVPYGRIGAAALALLGLVVGTSALWLAEGRRLLPGASAVVNAAVLLVVFALPGWLGLGPWRPSTVPADSLVVLAVGKDGGGAVPAEWVDAGTAAWQLRDVRVSVEAVTVGPVELTGSDGEKNRTKEDYLQVWLRVSHEGAARAIPFQDWDGTLSAAAAPRLTDAAGKVVPAKTFGPGWEPSGRARAAPLFPGKSVATVLTFDPPAQPIERLRLELPGTAFGGGGVVRFQIDRPFTSPRFTR